MGQLNTQRLGDQSEFVPVRIQRPGGSGGYFSKSFLAFPVEQLRIGSALGVFVEHLYGITANPGDIDDFARSAKVETGNTHSFAYFFKLQHE